MKYRINSRIAVLFAPEENPDLLRAGMNSGKKTSSLGKTSVFRPKKMLLLFLAVGIAGFYWFGNFSNFQKDNFPSTLAYTKPVKNIPIVNPLDDVIFNGPRTKKYVALTFDADMTPSMKEKLLKGNVKNWYNKKIIEILNTTQTKATLFLTGMWIELYPQETKMLASNKLFELGNHSYSHGSFYGKCYGLTPISSTQVQEEMQKTQQLLLNYTGHTNRIFRFPGGCYNSTVLKTARKLNLQVIQWDIAGGDGHTKDYHILERNVLSRVKNGSIIVFHLHGGPYAPKTADALPRIIHQLKAQGYEFVKVSDLI